MKSSALKRNTLILWIEWHFFDAPREILKAWKNLLLFNLRFFPIFFLIKTFFSYWHKYRWHYGKSIDIKRYLETFFSNFVSRVIGAVMRSVFIILGLMVEIVIFVLGIAILIFWLFLPILSIIGIISGFNLIHYVE